MLVLHLVPDGVGGLHAFLNLILDAHLLQRGLDGSRELVKKFVTGGVGRLQLSLYIGKFVWMLELETEIFQFRLDLIQSQTIGEGCIDIERFTCNLILFVGRLGIQSTHIVQTVADLDEDHADIVAHRQQQFLEVLSLG